MRATRHNGRSGKHGVYNPKHNDRKFDIANSEHIDAEREKQNIYWDCYRGYVQNPSDETLRNWGPVEPEASFHDIEKMYYEDHYSDFIKGQNARNEKNRHPERNRTTEDLLKNKMTCPEETIFQIGKEGEHISGEQLFHIADTFMKRFEGMFGEHVHILDFALHMDETTPHIHERHVFDCENKYGELCPQQEKALEALGIPLPDPDKPRGRNNNRKMTFDLICRNLLFDVCRQYGLEIEEVPEYGGKKYLEKQEVVEVIRVKKLYCMNCGTQIKGGIPNKCSCGAEFDLADTKNIKKIITSIIFFVILMSPLLILIHFGRQYLQASIILYALLLIIGIFWYRIVQTILVRLGLVTMTNIEIK